MWPESGSFGRCVQAWCWRVTVSIALAVVAVTGVFAAEPNEEVAGSGHVQIEAGLAYEHLSNGLPDWSSVAARLNYQFDSGELVYAAFRNVSRFGKTDEEWSLGSAFGIGDKWVLSTDASIAPDADVLPRAAGSLYLQRILDGGWVIGFGLRHSSYKSTYADVESFSVERYLRAYRFAYRISSGKAEGADRTITNEIRADFYYKEPSMVGFSLVSGQESESVGIGRLIRTDVAAASLQGLHWFTQSWAVYWRVGYHRQGRLYSRTGVDVSLRHRF